MSPMGCILTMMPTVMPRVFALSARMVPGTAAFPITCDRLRTWQKFSTTVPAQTGQRGKKGFWACRTY